MTIAKMFCRIDGWQISQSLKIDAVYWNVDVGSHLGINRRCNFDA
jgi:hypothetical protein